MPRLALNLQACSFSFPKSLELWVSWLGQLLKEHINIMMFMCKEQSAGGGAGGGDLEDMESQFCRSAGTMTRMFTMSAQYS